MKCDLFCVLCLCCVFFSGAYAICNKQVTKYISYYVCNVYVNNNGNNKKSRNNKQEEKKDTMHMLDTPKKWKQHSTTI